MWRTLFLSAIVASSSTADTCDPPATKTATTADTFVAIGGELAVDPPLNIAGPYPETVRQMKRGHQLLVQIRYPIVPPMPGEVAVASEHDCVQLVSTARTSSEVAILERNPRMGGLLGVGFVQVLLRATTPGKDLVTVRLKRADGSVKIVPLTIEVQ